MRTEVQETRFPTNLADDLADNVDVVVEDAWGQAHTLWTVDNKMGFQFPKLLASVLRFRRGRADCLLGQDAEYRTSPYPICHLCVTETRYPRIAKNPGMWTRGGLSPRVPVLGLLQPFLGQTHSRVLKSC